MSESNTKPMPSADTRREKAWRKRKQLYRRRARDGNRGALTDADLEELKGCIDLDFCFDVTKLDPKLSKTLPALELLHTVNKLYEESKSKSKDEATTSSDEKPTTSIIDAGDDPKTMKTKLKHWAKAVTCLVQQYTPRK